MPRKVSRRPTKKGEVITCRSDTIRTVDDLVKVAKIDLTQWKIVRGKVNKWDVTTKTGSKGPLRAAENWQVTVWIEPLVQVDMQKIIADVMKPLKKTAPKLQAPKKYKRSGFLLELCPFDAHFGKLCYHRETNSPYDLGLAEQAYMKAMQDLLARAEEFKIEKIVYVLGNDLFHINNADNSTYSGTMMDVDSRLSKIYKTVLRVTTRVINMAMTIAPVDVIYIPGNHDKETVYFLAETLKAYYNQTSAVTVDAEPISRKYYNWGECIIGWTHGMYEKADRLPGIMSQEVTDFSLAKYKEWHTGHIHKRKEWVDSHYGVVCRSIPALTATDHWHHERGFIDGLRSADAFIWDKDNGVIATLIAGLGSLPSRKGT